MAEQFPTHKILPDDDTYREVTLHGAISADPAGVNEFRCAVYFATRRTRANGEAGDYSGLGQSYLIGTGSLPSVPIGSIYKGRELVSLGPPSRPMTETFDAAGVEEQTLGPTAPFQSPSKGPGEDLDFLPTDDSGAATPIYRLGLPPISKRRNIGGVLVPTMEVIRYLWGPTTETSKRVFDGLLGRHSNPRESLFDPTSLKIVSRSKLRVQGFRRPTPGEMLVAARLASGEQLRRAYLSVSNRLRLGEIFERPVYASMVYPFEQPTEWRYQWRWVGIPDSRHVSGVRPYRFITRILDIDFRQPVREVIWSVPAQTVSSGKPKKKSARRRNAQRKKNKVTQTLSSTEPSQPRGRTNIILEPEPAELPFRWQVKGRAVKDATGYLVEQGGAPTKVNGSGSTADGNWGSGVVVPVSYRDGRGLRGASRPPDPRPVPPRLSQVADAFKALQKRYRCTVDILPENLQDEHDLLWQFPTRSGTRRLSWSTISSFTGLPRRALVAVVERQSWKYLCIESEMRDPSDFHTLCVFRLDSSRRIKDETVRQFLSAVSRAEGVWRNIRSTYEVRGRTHNQEWSAAQFAARIMKTFASFEEDLEED